MLRHLGAAVLLCWSELSLTSQVKIPAQANDVIGTRLIADARNEIVKLFVAAHQNPARPHHCACRAAGARIFPELISPPFGNPLRAIFLLL